MKEIKTGIKLTRWGAKTPEYKTIGSSGADLTACMEGPITLKPLERTLVPTGVCIELPPGTEAQVRPRSGLAIKHGITCLNTPGTIDQDYRGEIKVILVNLSNEDYTINNGERIAQLVCQEVIKMRFDDSEELNDTVRGDGGFGHTGK